MSVETLSTVMRKAKKEHIDSAGVWIRENLSDIRGMAIGNGLYELTFAQFRAIATLKANNWKILKGQIYQDNVCKQDGELYSFKCDPKINSICHKLDLYQDC